MDHKRFSPWRVAALVTVVAMLCMPPSALADPDAPRAAPGQNVAAAASATPSDSQAGQAQAKVLPFTGLDLFLLVGGGTVLVVTGAGLGMLLARRREAA